jgi:hypothetical protein
MRKIFLVATALAGIAAVLAAPQAHATPQLVINADGGGVVNLVNVAGTTGAGGTTLTNGVFVFLGANSNAPGGTNAQLFSSTINIVNGTNSTQTVTLAFIQNGYTSPMVPPNAILENGLSGTWSANMGTSTISAIGCTDATNSAGLTQTSCPSGSTSTAALFGTVTGDNGSFGTGNTDTILVTTPLSLYSIDEIVTISIGAGGNFNLTDSESLVAVPEPASLAVLGIGLIGLGALRGRRKTLS